MPPSDTPAEAPQKAQETPSRIIGWDGSGGPPRGSSEAQEASTKLPPETLRAAGFATLSARPVSPEAERFCEEIVAKIQQDERARGLRVRGRTARELEDFSAAVAGFVGDLILADMDPPQQGLVYRSQHANSFSGGEVAYRPFMAALRGLARLGLLEVAQPGVYVPPTKHDFGDTGVLEERRAWASRFRATADLIAAAATHLGPGDWQDHFTVPRADRLISLRKASVWVGGTKVKGTAMEVPDTEKVRHIKAQVQELNDYLGSVQIMGASFRGFYRGFEKGEQNYRWNKGGRLYAEGRGNYQQARKAERLAMTLDGRPVAEIDVKASFVAVLHGLAGEPLPPGDPYEVPGFPREVVKAWITATLGLGRAPKKWASGLVDDYRKRTGRTLGRDFPIRRVAGSVEAALPVVARIEELGIDWADLMFPESEAIIAALFSLKAQGIPALPIHDSLLVPADAVDTAVEALTTAYTMKALVTPDLEVRRGV